MSTPAGWYPDPQTPGQHRYWDGTAWSEQTSPAAPVGAYPVGAYPVGPAMPGDAPARHEGAPVLAIVALVLAVVIAPVGLILSIIGFATAHGRRAAKILSAIALVVSLLIIAACATAVVLIVKATEAPAKVSDEFVSDLQRDDAAAAYALTGKTFRAASTEQDLATFVQSARPTMTRPAHRLERGIWTSSDHGTVAEVIYSTSGSRGTAYLDVELERTGGDWKVVGLNETKTRPHLRHGS